MIQINNIKIEVNTTNGLFGSFYKFNKGLNIIRGDNTSGKSSLFQAIIYCLGFEELIGGINDKTMQSVLKDDVEYPKKSFHKVTQSYITLEIENINQEVVTIKRSVTSNSGRKPQLLDVFFGSKSKFPNENLKHKPMFVHHKGGASDEDFGFHQFLETFLGTKLPKVLTNSGDLRKLYLQQVASTYIIEQKTGWSDFFATMPHYGLQNKESRVIEFLLNMDIYENKKVKQKILFDRRIIENNWKNIYQTFLKFAEKGGGKLIGVSEKPEILNSFDDVKIFLTKEEKDYSISNYINLLIDELSEIESKEVQSTSENISENENKLESLNEQLNQESLNTELTLTELVFDREKFNNYNNQLQLLNEDLRKNKGALKVKKLGADFEIETAKNNCPTCQQDIEDSLLPDVIEQVPMRLDDNINYLESQIKMIKVYINSLKDSISKKENSINETRKQQSEIRTLIRQIKTELITDDRLPSIVEIEKRLNLKKRVEFYSKYLDDFNLMIEELKIISSSWDSSTRKLSYLSKDFMSIEDKSKLTFLESEFKKLLKKFNYSSKSLEYISISNENYLPVAKKPNRDDLFYSIKFDSSASDFVRSIWAYTCSLYKTSKSKNGNHPMLLMLDEPKQQDLAISDFKIFLNELSSYKEGQVLLFASFENSDETFKNATENIEFKLNHINDRLIMPIENKEN